MLKMTGIHVSIGTSNIYSHDGELTFDQNVPVLHSNSSGAWVIANDPEHFKRTKHIDIANFFLHDEITNKQLVIAPVQSCENLANILTKPLATPMLSHIQQLLGLTISLENVGLRGGAENDDPMRW